MRTDLTSEIDNALAGRNAGARGFWEVARSGNGDMMTDLMDEDGIDYEEFEGLGEAVEEMSPEESAAADAGRKDAIQTFREAKPGENPPHAPKPGRAWVRRRIPMQTRKPGGYRLCRCRWAQVTPAKWEQLKRMGKVKASSGVGFFDVSSANVKWAAIGGIAALGAFLLLTRKPKARVLAPVNS